MSKHKELFKIEYKDCIYRVYDDGYYSYFSDVDNIDVFNMYDVNNKGEVYVGHHHSDNKEKIVWKKLNPIHNEWSIALKDGIAEAILLTESTSSVSK